MLSSWGVSMMDRRQFIDSVLCAIALGGWQRSAGAVITGVPRTRTPLLIDSLSIGSPIFDAKQLLSEGLQAAVVDIALYPRTYAAATEALQQWQIAFAVPGSALYPVL